MPVWLVYVYSGCSRFEQVCDLVLVPRSTGRRFLKDRRALRISDVSHESPTRPESLPKRFVGVLCGGCQVRNRRKADFTLLQLALVDRALSLSCEISFVTFMHVS